MKNMYFPLEWVDMFKDLSDSQSGRLLKGILAYQEGIPTDGCFIGDSILSSLWDKVRSMIDADVVRRSELSKKRKLAGSLGGKRRAERFHFVDGHTKPSFGTGDVAVDDKQVPLYEKKVLDDASDARVATVRVLPNVREQAVEEQAKNVVPLPLPAVTADMMVKGGKGLLQAVGSYVSSIMPSAPIVPVYMPVMACSGQSGMMNFFPEYTLPEDESDTKSKKKKKPKVVHSKVVDDPLEEKEVVRHRYGEHGKVLLSDDQLEALKRKFPDSYEDWIRKADDYCDNTGKTYRNFYLAICNWAERNAKKNHSQGSRGNYYGNKQNKERAVCTGRLEDHTFYNPLNQENEDSYLAMIKAEEERIRNLSKQGGNS